MIEIIIEDNDTLKIKTKDGNQMNVWLDIDGEFACATKIKDTSSTSGEPTTTNPTTKTTNSPQSKVIRDGNQKAHEVPITEDIHSQNKKLLDKDYTKDKQKGTDGGNK